MFTPLMKPLSEKASIDRVSTDHVIGADATAIKARISDHAASHSCSSQLKMDHPSFSWDIFDWHEFPPFLSSPCP